ncbi:MAG TPA: RES family NAD+ phosphorylase [Oligoflexia bacterium]|nr:RES family NAD+ phosphorylase [Oligoflexia bacterium]HMR25498.1 RES family NAD+ phosphorylase [Oligoflexia bacterium]
MIDFSAISVWEGESYRNITTCFPSQDLLDDLSLDESDKVVLQYWENKTSNIDHSIAQLNRVFQYGDTTSTLAIFDQLQWNVGRFNTADFGVWYGALEAETSEIEALHWFYQHEKERLVYAKTDIHRDRKMFKAKIKAEQAFDLRARKEIDQKQLISENYSYTQSLAQAARASGVELFLAPSARNLGGNCTPIFKREVIVEDQIIYYLRFTLTKQGEVYKTKQGIPQRVLLPA